MTKLFFISLINLISFALVAQESKISGLKKYVYPILLFSNSDIQATGSGFFISTSSSTFLVTARHLLYENALSPNKSLEKWRGYNGIKIPIVTSTRGGLNTYSWFDLKVAPIDNKINSIKITDRFVDLIIIRVHLPKQIPINFVDLSISPSIYLKRGVASYITGYPEGETSASIVTTKILSNPTRLNGTQQSVFITETDSRPGVSGSPVFTFNPLQNKSKPIFLGVYTGYQIDYVKGKKKVRGTVVNGNVLIEWLKGK